MHTTTYKRGINLSEFYSNEMFLIKYKMNSTYVLDIISYR